ncbi:MAG: FmdE family protein [Syntrophobacteraceae bacterium]|jgi:formylmethanofuran dehydrogenase subunit E
MTRIGQYSFEEYLKVVESFHGFAAPGLLIGGFMVDLAMKRMPGGVFFNAVCETPKCLPDALQLLTPCTVGNGRLKIFNLGRFALSLYEKHSGEGVRVFLDAGRLESWPEITAWLFKLKPKAEQNYERLLAEIREAGQGLCGVQSIRVHPQHLHKKSRGRISTCILCGEPYPLQDGAICRACQGDSPYVSIPGSGSTQLEVPPLRAVCLKHNRIPPEWVHEDEAAIAFAKAMVGEGVTCAEPVREGRINLMAGRDGLFVVDEAVLERFNMVSGVICACRKTYTVVTAGRPLAATRAIPSLLPGSDFKKALAVLDEAPLFRVLPMRKPRVGILVTGTEVFQGLIEDWFIPIIRAKVERYECSLVQSLIVPDDQSEIVEGIRKLVQSGADLLITTAGLSLDPDDVTRHGLLEAGATDMLYDAPFIPGARTLLANIGGVQVMGVPACALYFNTTSLDLLLPRLLAGLTITRRDLARMGHGSFCLGCKTCTFPKCPFG